MPRAAKRDLCEALAVPVGGVVALRARVAETHRPGGARVVTNPGRSRSPLDAVDGWKLGLLITDFARFINSEIAPLCGWQGAATRRDLLVGSGGTHEEIARPLEGGSVGRVLHRLPMQRAALEPLEPSSRDRLCVTAVEALMLAPLDGDPTVGSLIAVADSVPG
jgi:hypothetical protein